DIFLAGIGGRSALYRNLGNWKFEEITDRAGVQMKGLSATGAVLADLDGDGDLDLLVNTMGHGTHLFLNNGKRAFTNPTHPPLSPGKAGMSMAVADLDGDGFLDLYIANYRTDSMRNKPNAKFVLGQVDGRPSVLQLDGRRTKEPDLAGRFEVSPSGQIIEHGE